MGKKIGIVSLLLTVIIGIYWFSSTSDSNNELGDYDSSSEAPQDVLIEELNEDDPSRSKIKIAKPTKGLVRDDAKKNLSSKAKEYIKNFKDVTALATKEAEECSEKIYSLIPDRDDGSEIEFKKASDFESLMGKFYTIKAKPRAVVKLQGLLSDIPEEVNVMELANQAMDADLFLCGDEEELDLVYAFVDSSKTNNWKAGELRKAVNKIANHNLGELSKQTSLMATDSVITKLGVLMEIDYFRDTYGNRLSELMKDFNERKTDLMRNFPFNSDQYSTRSFLTWRKMETDEVSAINGELKDLLLEMRDDQ